MTEIFNRKSESVKRKILRGKMTEAETAFWDKVRKRQVNNKRFRRQVSIGPYIADFYCPEIRLVVEIDGGVHLQADSVEYDQKRDMYMYSLGLTVVRFTNEDVLNNCNQVISRLEKYCI